MKKNTNYYNMPNQERENIDPETILTILLNAIPKGINYQIIREYIEELKQILVQKKQRAVIYGIDKPTLERLEIEYPEQFFVYDNLYYKGVFFRPDVFKGRNTRGIRTSLNEALQRTLKIDKNH